jgi:hypothetical protein
MIWITRYNDAFGEQDTQTSYVYGRRSLNSDSSERQGLDYQAFLLFFIIVEVLSCIAAFVLAIFAFMVKHNRSFRICTNVLFH